jgi:hypothetical protein
MGDKNRCTLKICFICAILVMPFSSTISTISGKYISYFEKYCRRGISKLFLFRGGAIFREMANLITRFAKILLFCFVLAVKSRRCGKIMAW